VVALYMLIMECSHGIMESRFQITQSDLESRGRAHLEPTFDGFNL